MEHGLVSNQFNLDLPPSTDGAHRESVSLALEALATNGGIEARGAIFTRIEVVEFILDLVGYTSDRPIYLQKILEPSFGSGDFLFPIVDRLLDAWKGDRNSQSIVGELGGAIYAVELHRATYSETRTRLIEKLTSAGICKEAGLSLADSWLTCDDFLLAFISQDFDFVVGNPPYVRQENIPEPLLVEYRCRFQTMFDRADIYIPFIERSLKLLKDGGSLGFICADRWMKNRYGGPLRNYVAENFHLKILVDMVDTPAFQSDVSTYPAISIIDRKKPGSTRVAIRPVIERQELNALVKELKGSGQRNGPRVRNFPNVTNGSEPWLFESVTQTELIRRLEREFPTLEQAGCKVGIGVATGADKAFIGDFDALDVEDDRKLPLATTRDILTGKVQWQGKGVINPFDENNGLVDLADYPRLEKYLEDRKELIVRRHCAKKNPNRWYRTIDRIHPGLARKSKLLIPDIKGAANIVFEGGKLYPHHNLYYVIAEQWDLRALQAVLLSAVTRLFIATYSTKMRGGYLRFQAQYLRRIRIPQWEEVPEDLRSELSEAGRSQEQSACDSIVAKLYQLNSEELNALGANGN